MLEHLPISYRHIVALDKAIHRYRAHTYGIDPKLLVLRRDRVTQGALPTRVLGLPIRWIDSGPDDVDIA